MARFTITLNDEIHQKLKEQAIRDHRTLGQEIAYLIELYVPTYQPQTYQNLMLNDEIPARRKIIQ